jgi:hypothetical protein
MGTPLRRDGHVWPAYVTPVIEDVKMPHISLRYPSHRRHALCSCAAEHKKRPQCVTASPEEINLLVVITVMSQLFLISNIIDWMVICQLRSRRKQLTLTLMRHLFISSAVAPLLRDQTS